MSEVKKGGDKNILAFPIYLNINQGIDWWRSMEKSLRNKIAIFCALGASTSFSLNDAIIKLLSPEYPLHQIVLTRSVIAITITLSVFVQYEGGFSKLKTGRPFLHISRGLAIVCANVAFFAGLAIIPIGTAVSIFFVAPLLITIFSAIFLKEHVNLVRWVLLIIGLGGVFLIVQPGTTQFQWAYLLPVLAAICYAITNTLTRSVGLTESASALSFYIQIMFLVVSGTMSLVLWDGSYNISTNQSIDFLTRGWKTPTGIALVFFPLIGICTALAGFLVSQAYRYGEAGLVTPFEYTALVLSIFWGYLIWGEIPGIVSALGMLLILGSGVYVLFLEAKLDIRIGILRKLKTIWQRFSL